jgi:hypothetical protein
MRIRNPAYDYEYRYVVIKAILKGWKSGLFVDFGQFPCPLIRIRIRIPNTDPDPGEPNHYGSGSQTLADHYKAIKYSGIIVNLLIMLEKLNIK